MQATIFVKLSQIAQDMAREATRLIKKTFPDIPIDIKAVQETPENAVGNGTGIRYHYTRP